MVFKEACIVRSRPYRAAVLISIWGFPTTKRECVTKYGSIILNSVKKWLFLEIIFKFWHNLYIFSHQLFFRACRAGSEHLVSQVTTHEHLVEIVQ